MQKEQKITLFTKFYALSMVLYMLAMYDVTWFSYSFSYTSIRVFITIVCLIKMSQNATIILRKQSLPLLLLFIYCMYSMIVTHIGDKNVFIKYVALFLSMTSIVMLTKEERLFLLKLLTNVFVIILSISLFGWFLFLFGFNLPHSGLIYHWNGFHEYYNYYLFRIAASSMESEFMPRFQSIFLEPGQLGTPCVFLLFLNLLEDKMWKFKNIILLLAILLSFSLISYGLLLIVFLSISWFKGSRYRVFLTMLTVVLIGAVYYFVSYSDNAVNALIISRLERDDEMVIVGNNRTATIFDINYASFIRSSNKYFGIHNELSTGYNWTNNSSGYKKFIVHEGIVGLVLFMILIISLFLKNKNIRTFVFLVVLVMAFFVRNLLQNPLWLSIAIIGFYSIGDDKKQFVQSYDSQVENKLIYN